MGRWLERGGVLASLALWGLSLPVLALLLRSIDVAPSQAGVVLWGLLFVGLQLAGPLLLAFTLRAARRWRTAVCFTCGAACGMLLDAAAMAGLLLWLRVRVGAG